MKNVGSYKGYTKAVVERERKNNEERTFSKEEVVTILQAKRDNLCDELFDAETATYGINFGLEMRIERLSAVIEKLLQREREKTFAESDVEHIQEYVCCGCSSSAMREGFRRYLALL